MPRQDRADDSPDPTAVLGPDPLDLRRSLTTVTHWAASSQLRHRVMADIDFPVDDVPMFLVVNQLTYRGAMRPTDLAAAIGTGAANVSKIVRRLEALDLATRTASTRDDRSVLVALTERGRLLGERILASADERYERMLETWTEEDRATLQRMLARLARDVAHEHPWMRAH